MASFVAVYDACVLYPAPLRDLLLRLALTDLFRARWTERIHEEWTRSVLKDRPDLTAQQLQRTRELMNLAVPDCLVIGYEGLIDHLRASRSKSLSTSRTKARRSSGRRTSTWAVTCRKYRVGYCSGMEAAWCMRRSTNILLRT